MIVELWNELWAAEALPGPELQPLLQAYGAAARFYHNLEHIQEVLQWSLQLPVPDPDRRTLQLALVYHDVVYDSRRTDNEERSAELARAQLSAAGYGRSAEVASLIMDTRHEAEVGRGAGLAPWMVDVDLSVLGSQRSRFERYHRDVRREYGWVPWFLYRSRRRKVLQSFLARPQIFTTDYFFQRLEAQARANLQWAIDPGSS